MGVICALAGAFYAAAAMPAAYAAIVVVYDSAVDAYAEAMVGMRAALDAAGLRVLDLHDAGAAADLARQLGSAETRVVIAVGSHALAEVQAHKPGVPLVATMVLEGAAGEGVAARVDLDIPFATQLEAMRALLPHSSRVGIIRNPAHFRYSLEALESRARRLGFTVVPVDADGAAHLLKAVNALKGKVDFLLCFPDAELYNAATIKPLILASLEDRVPVVAFSPAFVRAGAAVGIYADYRETGRQTAAVAMRLLRGEEHPAADEPPAPRISINQRVARLLGVEFHANGQAVEWLR